MSRALFVDPGVTCPGVAIFNLDTKRLFAARYFSGRGFHEDVGLVLELALEVADWARPHGPYSIIGSEWPQIYRAGFNPNRMLPMALFLGALTAFLNDSVDVGCTYTLLTPSKWKGQVKKKVTARAALDAFKPGELDAVDQAVEFLRDLAWAEERPNRDLRHATNNTMDAVAFGMFLLGRMETQ
jgi:hypothetical protein